MKVCRRSIIRLMGGYNPFDTAFILITTTLSSYSLDFSLLPPLSLHSATTGTSDSIRYTRRFFRLGVASHFSLI